MSANIDSARHQMVTQQVRAWSVLDPTVLRVMAQVPREQFVPPRYRSLAFADAAIPLDHGQQMLTPQVTGRLLQALEITPADSVLEVGTGSGFITACLGRLAARVVSLELRPELAEAARLRLAAIGVRNCEVLTQDAFQWQPTGQFNCIAITGSLPVLDPRFQGWLAPGGRLFLVVGEAPVMEAVLIRRDPSGTGFLRESLFETMVPPLDNAPRPEPFVF